MLLRSKRYGEEKRNRYFVSNISSIRNLKLNTLRGYLNRSFLIDARNSIARRTDARFPQTIERKGGDGSATRLSPRDNPSRITYLDDASYVLVDVNPERPT